MARGAEPSGSAACARRRASRTPSIAHGTRRRTTPQAQPHPQCHHATTTCSLREQQDERIGARDRRRRCRRSVHERLSVDLVTMLTLLGHARVHTTAPYDRHGKRAKKHAVRTGTVP